MSFSADLRYALRLLRRSPVFTVTAVLSLSIGIAASTAIFSLADAIMLRPRVGISEPARLVDVGRSVNGQGFDNFGYPLFAVMRERTTLFEGMSAQRVGADVMSLGGAESSERVFAMLVSGSYFDVLGTRPAIGRFFLPEEDGTVGSHPVVVLAHEFWVRRFAADEAIVGRTLRLNNLPYTVIGVAEPGFTGSTVLTGDFWVPMAMEQHVRAADRPLLDMHEASWMMAIGRLRAGATASQAQAELDAIRKHYMSERGDQRVDRWGIAVAASQRIPAMMIGPVAGFIAVLGTLTGLVLLIACSNVAAMLLARALERRREVATRLAVGATRGRILSQLLLEGLTLALIAGILSIPLAQALVALLSSFQPSLPVPIALDLQIDPRVMLFAFALSAVAALLFALAPALQATRFEVAPALHGSSSTSDRRRAWLRQSLVAAQVSMALLLLVAAGLFLRSLQEAATTDTGFNAKRVDTLQIDTRIAGYRTDEDGNRVVGELSDRFRSLPGVTAVGASRMIPLQGGGLGLGRLRAPGYDGPDGRGTVPADWDVVTPGYFTTLEVPIVEGRAFSDRDRAGAPRVAIVNERLAEQVWPGQSAVGKILLQQGEGEEQPLQVVGVARTAKYRMIGEAPAPFIYVPLAQQFLSDVTFYVRRTSDESRLSELRKSVALFDANLPVIHSQTLEQATAIGLLPQVIAAWIAGSVGSIGLLLAALGLYGVTAFSIAQRTREIALRMALGATRDAVLRMVLRQSMKLAALGAVAGLALAMAVGQLLQSLLVGVGAIDPLAFGAATVLLSGVLVAATWAPARRASRLDPMRALRAE